MLKLIKYLKPYKIAVTALIIFLFMEATAELFLPEVMGNIINNGIERGGVENFIPIIVDSSMKDKLVSLALSNQKNLIEKSYVRITSKDELKKHSQYKNLTIDFNKKELYLMNNSNKKEVESLNNIFKNLIVIIKIDDNKQIKKALLKDTGLDMNEIVVKQLMNFDTYKRQQKIKNINKNILAIENDVIKNIVVSNIKDYYKSIGLNLEEIQTGYIANNGKVMIICILFAQMIYVFVIVISAICSAGFIRNLRNDIFEKVSQFSKSEIDKVSISSLITRITGDVKEIQMFIFFSMQNLFFAPVYGIQGFIKMYRCNVNMSYIIVVTVISLVFIISLIFYIVLPKYKLSKKLVDKMNLAIREKLSGILVVRAFNAQKYEQNKFDSINKNLTSTNKFVEKIMALLDPVIFLSINVSVIFIVGISYKYIMNSTLQVGQVMACINYVICIIYSFIMLSMFFINYPRAQVSTKRIAEVLETVIEEDKDIINDNRYTFQGKIEFKHVYFKYPNSKNYILNDISFIANPGEITAIVGATGSGKSTIVDMIPRFYDVTDGEILLDGIDIRNISRHQLCEQISYAPQNGALFKGTVRNNLEYGNKDANEEDMIRALTIAQAKNFVFERSTGLDSEISQESSNISGGQRQRISIARAIIKKAPIYIFDDCFSALDFKTDLKLRQALYPQIKESTVIVIAQRVGTILNADRIIVLKEGKIVGMGKHCELIKSCDEYYQIASFQLPQDELL